MSPERLAAPIAVSLPPTRAASSCNPSVRPQADALPHGHAVPEPSPKQNGVPVEVVKIEMLIGVMSIELPAFRICQSYVLHIVGDHVPRFCARSVEVNRPSSAPKSNPHVEPPVICAERKRNPSVPFGLPCCIRIVGAPPVQLALAVPICITSVSTSTV